MSVTAALCVVMWCSSCVVSKCYASATCGTSVIVGGCRDSLGEDCGAVYGPSSTDVGCRHDVDSSTVLGVYWTVCNVWRGKFKLPKVPSASSCYTTIPINLKCVAAMTMFFKDST